MIHMGFGLFGLGGENSQIKNGKGAEKTAPSSDAAIRYKIAGELKNLLPGQTLSGEVIERNGNEVQIRINADSVILARLENALNITLGQNMTFEVKSNGGKQLALRPLFENLSQDPNILKALNAAGIQPNEKTTAMVSDMMEKGLPIDRNTLLQVYRDITANQDAAIRDIVSLHKLNLPVTAENLAQIKQYGNLEHQILNAIETVAEDIINTVLPMEPEEAAAFFKEIVTALTEGNQTLPENPVFQEAGQTAQGMNTKEENAGLQSNVTTEEALPPEVKQTVLAAEVTVETVENKPQELPDILSKLTPKEKAEFAEALKELGVPVKQDMSADSMLRLMAEQIHLKQPLKPALDKILSSKGMRLLLQTGMEKNMLLLPEQVADKEEVNKLYERIYEQTEKLSKIIQQNGREASPLAKSVENIRSNVEFMHQLNQTFTYIQLPIKMSGKNANGDLYVYTNKKNLAKQDGTVSALLHLEMEHLGTMDIYVAMQGGKVNTKFYLQKEEMLDFIGAHISILNERLNKRGYQMDAEMIYREQTTAPVQEMLQENSSTGILSAYSFDVRA